MSFCVNVKDKEKKFFVLATFFYFSRFLLNNDESSANLQDFYSAWTYDGSLDSAQVYKDLVSNVTAVEK